MNKKRINFLSCLVAGLGSVGCLFPSFGEKTKTLVLPELGLDAAFEDVKSAFQESSDCLQKGIDDAKKF